MLSIAINFLLVIHVIVSLLIILLVLMQRPKNEGLGAAFGGGMTENLFGAQTTNVLQTFTRNLGAIFFILTLLLSFLYVKQQTSGGKSSIQQRLMAPVAPAAPAHPTDESAFFNESKPGEAKPGETPAPAAETPAPAEKTAPAPAAATPAPAPAAATPAPAAEPAKTETPAPAPAPAPEAAKPETPAPAQAEKPADAKPN